MNEEMVLRAVLALESLANPELSWGDIIALSVGLAQCSLIAWGFRLMRLGTDQRREEAQQQHEETMAALHQQGEALRQQGKALETLIERTAQR